MQEMRRYRCLSDLLFSLPQAWHGRPLLYDRTEDGAWRSHSIQAVQQAVRRLACWLERRGIRPGDRIGLLAANAPAWCIADFAILHLGAVTVPAYTTDPAERVTEQFRDAGCRLIIVDPGTQQEKLHALRDLPHLSTEAIPRITADATLDPGPAIPPPGRDDLATLIYTSGTTGASKGVMLTHGNILADIAAARAAVPVGPRDCMLSFLPLSHAFERSVGQFLAVAAGCRIAYAESITTLERDMTEVRPTILLTVPRLLERIHTAVLRRLAARPAVARRLFDTAQRLGLRRSRHRLPPLLLPCWWLLDRVVHRPIRARMGGRLRLLVCGGAPLDPEIGRFALAAGIPLLPGYGLSECAPVVSVNRPGAVDPESVGPPLPGVELRIADDGELMIRGAMVMRGYWRRPEETARVRDPEGWLHSGDLGFLDEKGHLHIRGRKKELIVLSNGENIAPVPIEQRIARDPCIDQVLIAGDGRPWLIALVVCSAEGRSRMAREGVKDAAAWMTERIDRTAAPHLPHYARIRGCLICDVPWSQDNGLCTPTGKYRRGRILARHRREIDALYARIAHTPPPRRGGGDGHTGDEGG
ncbi:MAG: long-chain fatty acid--CoA ligase [Zetaproteobacteria bacterium]|nr:MAG: long-chain fatty acid--CoA ligase [Zetaproteobacteria bacterium]